MIRNILMKVSLIMREKILKTLSYDSIFVYNCFIKNDIFISLEFCLFVKLFRKISVLTWNQINIQIFIKFCHYIYYHANFLSLQVSFTLNKISKKYIISVFSYFQYFEIVEKIRKLPKSFFLTYHSKILCSV